MNWRKTSEKKPEFDKDVLVYCSIYGIYIGAYNEILDTGHGNWCSEYEKGLLPPMYWQPLPEPPKNTEP